MKGSHAIGCLLVLAVLVALSECRCGGPLQMERDLKAVFGEGEFYARLKEETNYFQNRIPTKLNTTAINITARDGVLLYTILTFPEGYGPDSTEQLPIILDRTPYGAKFWEPTLTALFTRQKYITATQDFRGCFNSTGEFSFWRFASRDGYDSIEYLSTLPFSNGKILAFGISADGIAATMEEQHHPNPPNLLGQVLMVNSGDAYKSSYPNGAYRESLMSSWLEAQLEPEWVPKVLAQEDYGPWWHPIDLSRDWNNTSVPALHVGGFYDIFVQETIDSFNYTQYEGGQGAKGMQKLYMNPWGHCGGGDYGYTNSKNAWLVQEAYSIFAELSGNSDALEVDLPLLNGARVVPWDYWSTITMYMMGPDPAYFADGDVGNMWICTEHFPETTNMPLYLTPDGGLQGAVSASLPTNSSFVYDPTNPVPTNGGNNLFMTCGPREQIEAEDRPDVLSFSSEPLSEPLVIFGDVSVTLYVASSANDTDFTGMLTDVYDGHAYNVMDHIVRMRWRNSYYKSPQPELMEPYTVYEVTLDLQSTFYVFNAGHVIRLYISSSNYPRFSVNLNNGNNVLEEGSPVVATNFVFHSTQSPSALNLPVANTDTVVDLACECQSEMVCPG